MLTSITGLIAAVAALVGALTGFVGMLVMIRRTSPRERHDAAEITAVKMLAPPTTPTEIANNLIDLHEAKRGDSDGPGNAGQGRR